MKLVIFLGLVVLLVFPMYLFQADGQLPGGMRTALHDNVVVLNTKQGKMVIELYPEEAPNHVQNFLNLVKSGFYDRTVFHRIIPDFMIQGGDPNTKPGAGAPWEWGKGDPGYSIDAEFNQLMHNRGMVSMARSASPDSAGSQFFIVHKNSNFLDGEYTVFGRLITQESYDTLDAIASLPTTTISSPGVGGAAINDVPTEYGNAEIISVEVQSHGAIKDKLDLGIPERMSYQPKIVPNTEPYYNTEYGFSFDIPRGFLVSEPERIDVSTPVVTAIGEKTGGYTPSIYVQVADVDLGTFEDILQGRINQLAPSIDAGKMELLYSDYAVVNGMDGYAISVRTEHMNDLVVFKQFIFPTYNTQDTINPEQMYSIVFSDSSANFSSSVPDFDVVINSFKINSLVTPTSSQGTTTITETIEQTSSGTEQSEGGGCLIATAAFGSEMAPQVQFLRELRDNTVLQTQSGTSFMTGFNQFYYSFSPAVADLERENPAFKETVKLTLTPLLTSLTLLNYIDIDTESEMLGYGIGIIMLNIGMYFVAPAILVKSVKRFLTKQK